jgi:membrane-bound lytic murein transglycosylase D
MIPLTLHLATVLGSNAYKIVPSFVEPVNQSVAFIQSDTSLRSFGFKNLFTAFSFNPNIPYQQQVNPNTEWFMSGYLQKHGKGLLALKPKAKPYFNLIDEIFRQHQLPNELKYLAVIESALNTKATSWVGAAGPWQFMPETAKQYGLVVNQNRDDRRDFFASSQAAAIMLKELYNKYHDWLLVIAAYNGGAGRVDQAIRKSNSTDFWSLQHHLPEESRNHVKKFIATHYIMESNHPSFHFFAVHPPKIDASVDLQNDNLKTVQITGKYIEHIIIEQLQMKGSIFQKLNPNFNKAINANNQYLLKLPEADMVCFVEQKQAILKACVYWRLNQQ